MFPTLNTTNTPALLVSFDEQWKKNTSTEARVALLKEWMNTPQTLNFWIQHGVEAWALRQEMVIDHSSVHTFKRILDNALSKVAEPVPQVSAFGVIGEEMERKDRKCIEQLRKELEARRAENEELKKKMEEMTLKSASDTLKLEIELYNCQGEKRVLEKKNETLKTQCVFNSAHPKRDELFKWIELLEHAVKCNFLEIIGIECKTEHCSNTKRVVQHARLCRKKEKKEDCGVCDQVKAAATFHKLDCEEDEECYICKYFGSN